MQPVRDELFVFRKQNKDEDLLSKPSVSFWKDALGRLKHNKLAMTGLGIIICLITMSIIGPMLVPYSYSDQSLLNANLPPSTDNWFGTDDLGRDIFSRTCLKVTLCHLKQS